MSWLDDLLGYHDVYAEGVIATPRRKALDFKAVGFTVSAVDNPLTGRTEVTYTSDIVSADPIETSGGSTANANTLDTVDFGAEANIEVAATFHCIETGGGAVRARFKRSRLFGRIGDTLSALQAIETIGTDYNNLAGGLGSVDLTISGDTINFAVTGDGTNDLTWWVEFVYSLRALA